MALIDSITQLLFGSSSGNNRIATLGLIILFIVLKLILASVPAKVAREKGYSQGVFFLFGLVSFVFALMTAYLIPQMTASKSISDDAMALSIAISDLTKEVKELKNSLTKTE